VQQLDRIGVPRTAYDAILTSGDAARELIREAASRGRRLGHLGPERDLGLFAGVGHEPVALETAETVVCTGLFDDERETPESYSETLERLARSGADMICANPDLTVERGGRIIYCAGALAKAFEALGGEVAYAGKPHLPIYRLAFEHIARLRGDPVMPGEVLAIGDGVLTDIAGAAAAGLDAVYVGSGVHLGAGGTLDAVALEAIFGAAPGRPIAAMDGLAW
jgi:HAD superfamily hydrolase (TIGR01459 family)